MGTKKSNRLAVMFLLLVLPGLVIASTVYETSEEFLDRAFNDAPPEPGLVWLSGDRKTAVRQLLGHDYPALRLRYWCRDERSAWMLEEIGKDMPITVGVVVEGKYIESLRVLTYRENRGGEVATPAFTDQFNGTGLDPEGALDTRIDGITGATLSVRALTRLASVALYLSDATNCSNDS